MKKEKIKYTWYSIIQIQRVCVKERKGLKCERTKWMDEIMTQLDMYLLLLDPMLLLMMMIKKIA